MIVNLYYGGRGVLDDPTLYVIGKIEEVLDELNVTVNRYNLYEQKNTLITLHQTIKEADAVILASTVEWIGIGGHMQSFLDSCWLYADKEKLAGMYMMPVVMSTTYGEKEGLLTLQNAWELLGGQLCDGVCGYVDDPAAFEAEEEYAKYIEKRAENLYRTVAQKRSRLPSSNQAVKNSVLRTHRIDLKPQESELLSKYVSNEEYVRRQKSDLEELTGIFSEKLGASIQEDPIIRGLKEKFLAKQGLSAKYQITVEGARSPISIVVDNDELNISYRELEGADVSAKLSERTLDDILSGASTFQKAFMSGDMTAKGDFNTLAALDEIFPF